jgi:hypothetical protein
MNCSPIVFVGVITVGLWGLVLLNLQGESNIVLVVFHWSRHNHIFLTPYGFFPSFVIVMKRIAGCMLWTLIYCWIDSPAGCIDGWILLCKFMFYTEYVSVLTRKYGCYLLFEELGVSVMFCLRPMIAEFWEWRNEEHGTDCNPYFMACSADSNWPGCIYSRSSYILPVYQQAPSLVLYFFTSTFLMSYVSWVRANLMSELPGASWNTTEIQDPDFV